MWPEMSSVFCSYLFCQLAVMWKNSPDFSVLQFHPSYWDAVLVYQEDTDPNCFFCCSFSFPCIKKNMLWQISLRNNFLCTSGEEERRFSPDFSSSTTLKLQMQKWFCKKYSCGYLLRFWVFFIFQEWGWKNLLRLCNSF